MSLSSEEKNTAYEKLTPQRKQLVDKVMENLEKGNLFWTQGWVSSGAPESAITGKKYRGINNLFLSLIAMSENYGDNRWATFKQMEEKGWTFKKDEEGNSLAKGKGASIEYYEMRDKETKKRFDRSVLDGMTASEQQEYMDKNVFWLRKFYRVFNCSLMDGVPVKEKPQIDVNDRNGRAEAILDYWDKNEAKMRKSKKTQTRCLRQSPTRIKSQSTFQGKNKHIGRPKIFSFTQSLKKRTLIPSKFTNAVSATKKAE